MREKTTIVVRFDRAVTEQELAAVENWVDELPYYLPTRPEDFTAEMYLDEWEPPDG